MRANAVPPGDVGETAARFRFAADGDALRAVGLRAAGVGAPAMKDPADDDLRLRAAMRGGGAAA